MKDTILTLLKYLLYLLLALVVLLFIVGVVYLMNWPWWVGIFLGLLLAGVIVAGIFVKRLLLRRKEQNFVQEVIEQDNEKLKSLSAAEQSQNKELQLRWKETIETLRRSHLKKQGNPLYVLPWYLVMGESGSGKTTAISSARLNSPFAEVHQVSGISGTRNCDWWFFDQAVILDTAGRYAMPVDSGRDGQEWQKFLSLLVKYRRKEPIHGLIMTVAADKLLRGSVEELEKDGLQLRRRLDELMRVLGIRFPVYLMVTKCDLVQGMTQFSDRLSDKSLEQPMGCVNQELEKDVAGFVQATMACVSERLKDLRVLLLHGQESPLPAAALIFPDEFLSLKKGVECFVKAAFQENRYQETPLLRGIYFSSGRQEGTPFSHFLGDLGLIGAREVLPGTSKGLFLHDFFDKVLPADRRLFAPTTQALKWQLLTRNLGLTAWLVLGIACCGLLSYSFVKNMATIRSATAVIARTPELKGEFLSDLAVMEQYRRMIVSVGEQNRNWWVPRFWLAESLEVETRLKERYCRQFQGRFLAPLDKNMSDTVAAFHAGTPDEVAGEYLVHLTRRINLLKARVEHPGDAAPLAARPLPSYVAHARPGAADPENSKKFGVQYLNHLSWRGDLAEMRNEIVILQSPLKHVVLIKGSDLRWLPEWVNRQGVAPQLTLHSFWGGTGSAPVEAVIPAACTAKGREQVIGFLGELQSAFPEPSLLDRERNGFEERYRTGCYAAWQNFVAAFPGGEKRLKGAREWQAAAEVMASDRGPYYALAARAASDLEPFGPPEGMPPALQQLIQYRTLNAAGGAAAAATRAVEEGKKLTEKVGRILGKEVEEGADFTSQSAAATAAKEYQSALARIAPAVRSRTQAYQLALQVFTEEPMASKSPFYLAYDAGQRLKGQMAGGRVDGAFLEIADGPLRFLWSYVQKEAACAIQTQWEEQVLKEAQGSSDPQTLQYLVAQEGPVWKFVNGSLGPFQGWSPTKGYYSKTALGGQVPFEPAFNSFLAKGAKAKVTLARAPAAPAGRQGLNVTIKGLPTDANADAKVKPQGTRLELQCAAGPQLIENLNYPVSKTFTWAPDACADVTFQIEIGELVLTRHYPGPQGLPAFLKDFQGGRHTFYPADFPREKAALERQGVRFIRANYQFSGVVEVLAQAGGGAAQAVLPGEIPRVITKCWD